MGVHLIAYLVLTGLALLTAYAVGKTATIPDEEQHKPDDAEESIEKGFKNTL